MRQTKNSIISRPRGLRTVLGVLGVLGVLALNIRGWGGGGTQWSIPGGVIIPPPLHPVLLTLEVIAITCYRKYLHDETNLGRSFHDKENFLLDLVFLREQLAFGHFAPLREVHQPDEFHWAQIHRLEKFSIRFRLLLFSGKSWCTKIKTRAASGCVAAQPKYYNCGNFLFAFCLVLFVCFLPLFLL